MEYEEYVEETEQENERNAWELGSSLSVYSRSKNTWFPGEIIHIYIDTDTNKEMLIVKYDQNKTKKIHRHCKTIKPMTECFQICICGSTLIEIHAGKCYDKSSSIYCDHCNLEINGTLIVYHCPEGHNKSHQYGYDLCTKCGSDIFSKYKAKKLSSNPRCICGLSLVINKANKCYSNNQGVVCDRCSDEINGHKMVYHCSGHKNEAHEYGFDLCIKCGNILAQIILDKPDDFLIVPHEIQDIDQTAEDTFKWKTLYFWLKSTDKMSDLGLNYSINPKSLTSYLQSIDGKNIATDFYVFNNKINTELLTSIDNDKYIKYEENVFNKHHFWTSSNSVTSFPALIAQIKYDKFRKHDELKECMNLYQINDSEDILNREMRDKQNINKRWNVVGLIDPDKNLSTLDHSLNLYLFNKNNDNMNMMNYHHWIPSVFKVNHNLTECQLLSEIPNLNPYKYRNTLYRLIEQLFLYQIDQFENITQHNLRGIPLKVIVKAQDYQLSNCYNDGDSYFGNMHKEGLYEDIIGVGLYYYHIDDNINGGELQLSSVINVTDSKWRKDVTTLKQIKINVKEKISLVFSNDLCYHRVSKLYGNGSRKIIAFFLLRPNICNNIAIDARFVVVNWKYHTQYLVLKWLKKENNDIRMHGYEWMLNIIFEYVVGNKKYIENATELYNQCRRAYKNEISYSKSDITSSGVTIRRIRTRCYD